MSEPEPQPVQPVHCVAVLVERLDGTREAMLIPDVVLRRGFLELSPKRQPGQDGDLPTTIAMPTTRRSMVGSSRGLTAATVWTERA